ncbi:MAG: M20/M25/M40 family metallo-hydrolase [Planctomycetes bacterium]|nr:M20/M25/M40 family metallo-hydrolase [Planctomycetota bacterium]
MQANLDWLNKNHATLVKDLADLVAVRSVSTDGEHQKEVEQSAELTREQMRHAGLQKTEILRCNGSNPYAYGEWLDAPGKPTVFLYAHHDVQPVHQADVDAGRWHSDPWKLTARDGRLFARGSADDKAAITAQLGAIASFLQTRGSLPVNVKMLVEGEEEVGSSNLMGFFQQYRDKIKSDVIVVCDTENIEVGLPSITYSLRGIVTLKVEVESATKPVHSGMAGGVLADAALALNVILAKLYWDNGPLPIPHYYDSVRPLTAKEKKTFRSLPGSEEKWREDLGILPGVRFATEKRGHPYDQTWRKPAVTIIAQEASSIKGASNQVLPRAQALVSCRIVPNQDPQQVFDQVRDYLGADPPWGVKVKIEPHGSFVKWWMTDPNGPAFEAARAAMKASFGRDAVAIGCGGSIGFVGPLADLLGGAPALLLGIEDPQSNAHAPDESLHEGDWRKLMASLSHLFENLGNLPAGKVK